MTMEEIERRIEQLEMQIAMLMAIDESILEVLNVKRDNRKTKRANKENGFEWPIN